MVKVAPSVPYDMRDDEEVMFQSDGSEEDVVKSVLKLDEVRPVSAGHDAGIVVNDDLASIRKEYWHTVCGRITICIRLRHGERQSRQARHNQTNGRNHCLDKTAEKEEANDSIHKQTIKIEIQMRRQTKRSARKEKSL